MPKGKGRSKLRSVDFTALVFNRRGEPMWEEVEDDDGNNIPLADRVQATIGHYCALALDSGDKDAKPGTVVRRGQLAIRIEDAVADEQTDTRLTTTEIAEILKRLQRVIGGPVVYLRCATALGDVKEDDDTEDDEAEADETDPDA